MSDALTKALLESQYSARENPFGIAAQSLALNAGRLSNPYASVGSNAAATIGAALLAGLMGGVARYQTDEDNARLAPIASQILETQDPAQREQLLAQEPRLRGLAVALSADAMNRQAELAQKRQELELASQAKIAEAPQLAAAENAALLARQKMLAPGEIDAAARRAEAEAAAKNRADINAFGYNPKQKEQDQKVAEAAQSLRKEIEASPQGRAFAEAAPIFEAISKGAKADSVAGDINLVAGLSKIYDPVGSVREGDVKLHAGAGGPWDQLVGELNGWGGKGRLRPETREKVLALAHLRITEMESALRSRSASTLETAKRWGLPESEVIPFKIPDYSAWKNPLQGASAEPPQSTPIPEVFKNLPPGSTVRLKR